jgi:hypothetical protein
MDRYISLLTEASNKADYRKRPIDTLKKVQQLANKSAKKREVDFAKKKIKYDESTPTRIAISEAVKKSGRKAFKEMSQAPNKKLNDLLYQKRVLELENAPPARIRAVNQEIDRLIGKQVEQEKLEKSLEKYKDRPEIYLAKLQEAKQEKEKETTEEQLELSRRLTQEQIDAQRQLSQQQILSQTALTRTITDLQKEIAKQQAEQTTAGSQKQIKALEEQTKKLLEAQERLGESLKSLPDSIKDVKNLLQLQLKPEQLLELDEEYRNLNPKEKKYLLEYLRKSTPRDTTKRAEVVKTYLASPSDERKKLLESITSEIPEKRGKIKDILSDKEIKKEKKHYINMTRWEDGSRGRQKKYVSDNLYADMDATDAESIKEAIDKYKLEWMQLQPKKTDIIIEEADDEEGQKEETKKDIEESIDESAKKEAEEEITREDADNILEGEDEPIVKGLKEELIKDGSEEADADDDAREVVAKTKAELSKKEKPLKGEASADTDEEDEISKITFPGVRAIDTMSASQILKFASDNNITLPESVKSGKGSLSRARSYLKNLRAKQKPKGRGFSPLSSHPTHLIAGAMAKHIEKVRQKRFKINLNKSKVFKNTENEEYRKGLKQHILRGGSFLSFLF